MLLKPHSWIVVIHSVLGCPWRQSKNCMWSRKWQPLWMTSQWEHILLPLKQLPWMSACFWVQFKVLVMIFKALPCPGTHLSKELSSPVCFCNTKMVFRLPHAGCCSLRVHHRWLTRAFWAFSIMTPSLWNGPSKEVRGPSKEVSLRPLNVWDFLEVLQRLFVRVLMGYEQ